MLKVCWWFGATKPPAHPADGTKFVLDTSENLHILTRLSARENFIEYNVLLGHVLFKCFEFLSENKVIIFCTLKFETININAVTPLGKVGRTLKISLDSSELPKDIA